ncbi:MAG TPA: SDR family oxidoreductase [Pirellulaceae bacterium]|nr:SDR family oxidoreductase [Pirellulaceae bacterium]
MSHVAFITGSAAPRVGRAIAEAFRQRGYRVVLHGNRARETAGQLAAEWSATGEPALAVAGDLSDETVVANLFSQIQQTFGRLDVLVNSAAIWEPKPLEDVTASDVRRHFEINTLGTFLCCQQAGRIMVGQESGGAIVNLGDWATVRPYLNYAAYFPSKGAIETLTRDFAVELAARNTRVRVNAVLPGPVMLPPEMAAEERAAAIAGTLLKREGHPQHVASAVLFLAEHEYITGVCLPVDGGRSIASG